MSGKSLMVVVIVMLLSANVMAEVPYNFASGSVVKSSEVNANFKHVNYGNIIVKDGSGTVIGSLIGIALQSMVVYTDNGYIVLIHNVTGEVENDREKLWTVAFTSGDCTGEAYSDVFNSVRGRVVRKSSSELAYIAKTATQITNITIRSFFFNSICSKNGDGEEEVGSERDYFYPLSPNNPSITGVNSVTFPAPITMDRK